MKTKLTVFTAVLAGALAFAQEPYSATYDSERKVRLAGPVTHVEWINPRAFVFMNVKDATGTVTNWKVEIGSPFDLEKDGWKPSSLNIGDVVTVDGVPARGESNQAFASSVMLGGKKLFVVSNKKRAAANAPAPRWPDGHIRLGPAPGKKGYWGAVTTPLVESTSVKIPMNADGLLVNIADADKVAPFQPWAKAVFEYRQRTLFKDDPYARCIPPGGPRQFQTGVGFQFVEQPELGRILLLLGGGDRNWRMIFTDGRPQGQGDDLVLTYYGTSTGHWDKDTLVVDSVGFNERFWFAANGLPHTEALHLTERFTRTDLNTLKYEVTVDDPRTYTRPWTGGWTMQWVPDQEIQEFFCEESAEPSYIR